MATRTSTGGGFKPGFTAPKGMSTNSRAVNPIVDGQNRVGGGYALNKVGDKVSNGPRAPYPYDKPRG